MPNNIKKLPSSVISKIAAGEVLENLASVVKELVENSIDAKAKNIEVILTDYGLSEICVVDDGVGMSKDDLELSCKRYTTSKLFSADEIDLVSTLGFRGEALYAISSVAKVIIKSRHKDDISGNQLSYVYSKFEELVSVGMPKGTVVTVRDLFGNFPARKKFVENASAQLSNIVKVVTDISIAYPKLSFKVSHNGKQLFFVPKAVDLDDRVRQILKENHFANLLPLNIETTGLKAYGFFSKPELSFRNRVNQHFFVNGRKINSDKLSKIIKEAYGSLLDPKSHPVVVLFLTIPPEFLNIHVHPRKEEVVFLNENIVLEEVKSSIKSKLTSTDVTYTTTSQSELDYTFMSKILRSETKPWILKDNAYTESEILQINNLYLVLPYQNGILLMDQHAAHEKILYHQFKDAYKSVKSSSKKLKNPVILELPANLHVVMLENLEVFVNLGFEIEEFGETTFKIISAPKLYTGKILPKILIGLLEDLAQDGKPATIEFYSDKVLAFLACRTAIKAGEYLTIEERRNLVKKVFETPDTYTCPHGRPVMTKISLRELERMFKRTK